MVKQRKTAGYQSYGSTKGGWKIGIQLILATLGGIGSTFLLLALERCLPTVGALTLDWTALVFGVIGMAACTRTGHFCWTCFLAVFCFFIVQGLAVTIHVDALAHATLIGGGSRPLLIAACVLLTFAIGGVLLTSFGCKHKFRDWVFIAMISVFVVFPLLNNSANVINVMADRKTDLAVTVEVLRAYTEKEYIIFNKWTSSNVQVHYTTLEENDLLSGDLDFKVSGELYSRLHPGDQVRIILHPGALGMPWAEVDLGK